MDRYCSILPYFQTLFPQVNGKYILKSGTDFRQFSKVTLDFSRPQLQVQIEAVDVTSAYSPDPALAAELEQVTNHSPAWGHVTRGSPPIGWSSTRAWWTPRCRSSWASSAPSWTGGSPQSGQELSTNFREVSQCPKKAFARASS